LERSLPVLNSHLFARLFQPGLEFLIGALGFENFSNLRRNSFEAEVCRAFFPDLVALLTVVSGDFFVRHQSGGTESLIDELEDRELPQQLLVQLLFGKPVTLELSPKLGLRAAKPFGCNLLLEVICFFIGGSREAPGRDFVADDLLIDQPVGCRVARFGAEIDRLAIEEADGAQIAFDVAQLDDLFTGDDGNTVD